MKSAEAKQILTKKSAMTQGFWAGQMMILEKKKSATMTRFWLRNLQQQTDFQKEICNEKPVLTTKSATTKGFWAYKQLDLCKCV